MAPRPLDLGPITTLTNLGRLPYLRMALVWTLFAALLIGAFWLTHGGLEQMNTRLSSVVNWFTQIYR
jgi:hypothetical protein